MSIIYSNLEIIPPDIADPLNVYNPLERVPVITLAEAKSQIYVRHDFQDGEIINFVFAAEDWLRNKFGDDKQIINKKYRATYPCFPLDGGRFHLPVAPLADVDKISYYDIDNILTVLVDREDLIINPSPPPAEITDPLVDPDILLRVLKPIDGRGSVYLEFETEWPDFTARVDAVFVEFRSGYGPTSDTVPEDYKQAVKLALGDLMANRGDGQAQISPRTRESINSILQGRLWGSYC